MNYRDEPRRQLKLLYEQFGADLLRPRSRAWSLLADVCGGYRAENFILGSVAREGLVELVGSKGFAGDIAVADLAHRVEMELGIDTERAQWAAMAWGEACGWVSVTSPGCGEGASQLDSERGDWRALAGLVEAVIRGFGRTIGRVCCRPDLPDDEASALASQCVVGPAEEMFAAVLWPSLSGARGLIFSDAGLRFRNPDESRNVGVFHLTYEHLKHRPVATSGKSEVAWDGLPTVLSTMGTGIPSRSVSMLLRVIREVLLVPQA